ncbi:MAG: 23S rRNA pseudouridine(955/2504/2580) synthase RluC [Gammaproteobacteria bacterium]|nr:23S rRNA pseudouridine(955/2504/2580) synthase RluC [Gammaproteobacteria bacterium]
MKQAEKINSKAVSITIDDDFIGQRLDNFLFNKLKNVPKTRIYKMLRKGEVRVNKKRVSQNYRLQASDQIRIPPYWYTHKVLSNAPSQSSISSLESRVLYEDDGMIILNKPAKMAVHGGSGINFGVIETMRAARPELKTLELVHRLDRDTSGCLLLAKKRSRLRMLHELLRAGTINKRYLVLVKGKWVDGKKNVALPLIKNQLSSGERIVKVNSEGKEALTSFVAKKVYQDASLLEATIHTGRTHQIRVHAATIGFPVAGDEKYGDKKFNQLLKQYGLHRLFLHAESLSFTLPDGKKIAINAKLDHELELVLQKLHL